jgi:sporulation protein YlmC with PRC-barrel domain
MPTAKGHTTAIRASRVIGTDVFSADGKYVGEIEDVVLDKLSSNVMFAVVSFGGVLGMGERYNPIPWSTLTYDEKKDGYVLDATEEQLKKAPAHSMRELTASDAVAARNAAYKHFGAPQYW